jgi:hypothetical protein
LLLPLRLEERFATDLPTLRQDLDITETGPGYLVVAGT